MEIRGPLKKWGAVLDTKLIRTKEYEERGMFVTAVYGLNFFVTNVQAIEVDQDPRVAFMRAFGDTLFRVAHVGDLALEGDDPQDYFTSGALSNHCLVVPIGLYNDCFYASPQDNGYVFFDIQAAFWTTQADERSGGINYVIGDDSLAIYVHRDASSTTALTKLLEQPPPGVQGDFLEKYEILPDWIDHVTMLFDYCAVTTSDGWQTLIYSRQPIPRDLVDAAIVIATDKIINNEWYNTHKETLFWEDYLAGCMVTPERRAYFRELHERYSSEVNA